MMIKIGLEKAYNRIDWNFLNNTFQKINFPSNIINIIMACVESTQFAILLNGSITHWFQATKGVKQGDPFHLVHHQHEHFFTHD